MPAGRRTPAFAGVTMEGEDARVLLRIAYRLKRWVWRWPTRGVRVLVRDGDGRVLLVRHSYGRRDVWMLPGGGIGRGEAPVDAAAREVREETGCTVRELKAAGVMVSTAEGRRDTVHLFRAVTADAPRGDGWEIAAVGLFAPDALPDLSPATRRRLDEEAGLRVPDGRW